MDKKINFSPSELRYLKLLAQQYPTVQDASNQVIRLEGILNLPKGTEHFMSDIHGEHEAFLHILKSSSGEIKEKLNEYFADTLSVQERNELATLIYYPEFKLDMVAETRQDMDQWHRTTLHQLIPFCHFVTAKHTRAKVRSCIPDGYEPLIDELLNLCKEEDGFQQGLYESIISSTIRLGQANAVIQALASVIKTMTCDHLHIVGDIFDRGPRADKVMDSLMECPSVDIQWGNHDILWMGAASGSRTMVATVLVNSIRYNNLDVIESGYGISLRPLSVFANETYRHHDTHCFNVKILGDNAENYSEKDKLLSARMYKAISIILFKLEGQKVMRHPEFNMADRLLLDKVNYQSKTITIEGTTYPLEDCDFPTVDPQNPYALTEEESSVIDQLTEAFRQSEKLQKHVRFLYSKGSLYKTYNGNLLFHGCVPMTEDGELMEFTIGGKTRSGREFMNYADRTARKAYYDKRGTPERIWGMDFLWWLWCGRNSPLFGRDRMTTFERCFIKDESTWTEPKNAYYSHYNTPDICDMLLKEFGLEKKHSRIINGHVPVKARKGESPIKGGGKLVVIDGGFSRAYQKTSGIAGYTLIFSSRYFRIVSHQPFAGSAAALNNNQDIDNDLMIIEKLEKRMKVAETDEGEELQAQVDDLVRLIEAYRNGAVAENHQS
jgi:fructose-1,6-bisphosphatase-3